jgi:anti-sigma factor RsiW
LFWKGFMRPFLLAISSAWLIIASAVSAQTISESQMRAANLARMQAEFVNGGLSKYIRAGVPAAWCRTRPRAIGSASLAELLAGQLVANRQPLKPLSLFPQMGKSQQWNTTGLFAFAQIFKPDYSNSEE